MEAEITTTRTPGTRDHVPRSNTETVPRAPAAIDPPGIRTQGTRDHVLHSYAETAPRAPTAVDPPGIRNPGTRDHVPRSNAETAPRAPAPIDPPGNRGTRTRTLTLTLHRGVTAAMRMCSAAQLHMLRPSTDILVPMTVRPSGLLHHAEKDPPPWTGAPPTTTRHTDLTERQVVPVGAPALVDPLPTPATRHLLPRIRTPISLPRYALFLE